MPAPVALREVTLIVVGGGTDAPGFKIVPDGHGGWKVVPVPGWNPEQMLELASALQISATAGRLKNAKATQAILNEATSLAASELAGVVGEAKGTTVVVMAG